MNYLAIDTSGSHLTVTCRKGEKTACGFVPECNLQHSVILMGEIEKTLSEAGMEAVDADFFACAVGPGSFTGIRIGVSTIKAFAYSFKKPVLAVTSFDTLAYNRCKEEKFIAVIDARHDNYYVCGYDGRELFLKPEFIGREELEKLADVYTLVSSTVLDGFKSETADIKDGFIKAVEAKSDFAVSDREQLVPLYIRKSQAEENT